MVSIENVLCGSPADKCGIKTGDILISVNGNEINDVLDYRFYLAEKNISVAVVRGEEALKFSFKKEVYDDIGLEFETPLMDKKQRCHNKCVFCFIDQLPKGLRDTLYFKDDDSRLSFLHGNYITMTNLQRSDIDRIVKMHISPVNVSVHTTNPELRCKMMHNKRAGEVLSYLDILAEAGIEICGQIVLCRGINDGAELERSLHDLAKYYPRLKSVCVVPSGLTKFRDGLYPLNRFDKKSSIEAINLVEKINKIYRKKYGKNIFFCSDEFYLMAEKRVPNDDYYEDYSQIDNGVGMLRSFECEATDYLKTFARNEVDAERDISLVTGEAAYDLICKMVFKIQKKFKKVNCRVYKIVNDFFGHTITVNGLVTGKDILNQLNGKELGNELIIAKNMLRSEGDLFLCGTSKEELSEKLNVKLKISGTDGASFVDAILGI